MGLMGLLIANRGYEVDLLSQLIPSILINVVRTHNTIFSI